MSAAVSIARPYAKAVFDLAVEQGTLDNWRDALSALVDAFKDEVLHQAVSNPRLEQKKLIEVIAPYVKKQGFSAEQIRFIELLSTNNRLGLLEDVQQVFTDLLDEHQARVHCRVLSAVKLGSAAQTISDALAKKHGSQVEVSFDVDPSLLGGIRIEWDDKVLDDSIRHRLHQIQTNIMQ